MSVNPYQAPAVVAEVRAARPKLPEHIRAARRWVATPAIGFRLAGLFHFGLGSCIGGSIFFFGIALVIQVATDGIHPRFLTWPRLLDFSLIAMLYVGGTIGLLFVGLLAQRYSRRLRQLSSRRDARVACALGFIMTPLCIFPLPLAIYTLIVLRRADVRAVLEENEAACRGGNTHESLPGTGGGR